MAWTSSLAVYRALTWALAPLAVLVLKNRAARGKEDPGRLNERLGRPTLERPPGRLIWLHAASVGESMMLLPLIAALKARRPEPAVLVTTGTVTSASLMAKRLPEGAIHQYAPIDSPGAAGRFIAHWRPDLAAFAESDVWPNLIRAAKASGAALALINARMTSASLKRWRRVRGAARVLFGAFDWIGPADMRTAQGLSDLLGRGLAVVGNLKHAGAALEADSAELDAMQAALADRPVWLAASTHPGEEAIALDAHRRLRADGGDWRLILVPRHPDRGPEIAAEARAAGLRAALRSAGEPIGRADVYIADTLGELGLWLRLSRAALIAGSLVEDIGGHNPLEAARLGTPFLVGPHTANFEEITEALVEAGGGERVSDAESLATAILALEQGLHGERADAARAVASQGDAVLETVLQGLEPLVAG